MFTQEQLIKKLTQFLQIPSETEWLENKEAKNDFDFDKFGQYFSGLSNEANLKGQDWGWVIFGVTDKIPRKIVGTFYRLDPVRLNSLKHEIAKQTNGLTFQEIYELLLPEGRVLMFQIPPALPGIPTSWKGHYFGRDGESLSYLSMQEIETIRHQIEALDWSAQICHEAAVKDLDENALQIARAKFQNKFTDTRFGKDSENWDTLTFLDKAKLTRNGKLTRATILLLGKPEAAHHLNPHPAQISWKLDTEEQAYAHFGPPFLLTVEDVFKHIRNINFRFQPRNHLIPIELSKYDPKIVLEALNNCIAHQDYTQRARVVIIEKIDRLILQSTGGFFDGTVDDYVLKERTPERYRNPFLVQAMVNLDMIDTMGMGIRRMFLEQRKRYFPLPEFSLDDANHVKLTIYGKLIDENYSHVLIENQDLSIAEVMILDSIQKKHKISKTSLQSLKKKRLIEGRYPNVFVSSTIAEATNKRAQYIKNRAFDSDHYHQLILKFIDRYGAATRAEIDDLIMNKLPEVLDPTQKKNKVGNLIAKMRRDGILENQGSDRSPNWARKKINT
jgi:ATP-dependent DNA helicase RecG